MMIVAVALLVSAAAASRMPEALLSNGVSMPVVAAGTWQYNDTQAAEAVANAIAAGFTHVDTALNYRCQRGVSQGLAAAGIDRGALFVTTKIPGCGVATAGFIHRDRCAEDSAAAVDADLAQLSEKYDMRGYIDLMLLHFPPCVTDPAGVACDMASTGCSLTNCAAMQQQWRALEAAYDAKKLRAIGVSNYCEKCLDCLKNEKYQPMVNQVQYHVGMGSDPQRFLTTNTERGIVVQAWSPLNDGHSSEILSGNLTTAIGAAHGKSAAQVALKYLLTKGVTVATKSSNAAHLRDDLDLFDFELSIDEMDRLDAATFAGHDAPSFACNGA